MINVKMEFHLEDGTDINLECEMNENQIEKLLKNLEEKVFLTMGNKKDMNILAINPDKILYAKFEFGLQEVKKEKE